MKITSINTFTTGTHNLKYADRNKNANFQKQNVSFGFGEDYGGDPFPMPECEGDGDGKGPWGVLKDALYVMFWPITLPITTYKIHLQDKKEEAMYREMLRFENEDEEEEIDDTYLDNDEDSIDGVDDEFDNVDTKKAV